MLFNSKRSWNRSSRWTRSELKSLSFSAIEPMARAIGLPTRIADHQDVLEGDDELSLPHEKS